MDGRSFSFPVGYGLFHRDQLFNFQLNRWYSLGYLRHEEIEQAGKRIITFEDWRREMRMLMERALAEERYIDATFFCRAVEFYTFHDDPEKERLYDRFAELFEIAFQNDDIERSNVPFGNSFLSVMRVRAEREKRGIIVMHGGFDSFMEEFYSWMKFFSHAGYEVIAFEGPGQGATLRRHGLRFSHEWERPVKAVLDHYRLDDVTLLGISMGGWLCFRAAAFEPRISRLIASGIAYDYSLFAGPVAKALMVFCFRYCRSFTNRMSNRKMGKDGMHAWTLDNLMYITSTETPVDAAQMMLQLNGENLHSERVTQDVLILTAREDHFIPLKMHRMQIKALKNARSVTDRIFTRDEEAHNHCQIGNVGLALDVMVKWIDSITRRT